jgi:glutaredoxin
MEHVEGSNRNHDVKLYALSTCPFCKKVKALLKEHDVAYDYVDMDLQTREERSRLREEVVKYNPRSSYPTLIVDGDKVVIGFRQEKIEEVLGV